MNVISLFSGAGGLDIGFEQAGFEIVVAIEQDPSCCETLRTNRPNLTVVEGDIVDFTGQDILDLAGLKHSEPALIIGGPPCQSFSLAGQRMGLEDSRGQLVHEFVRLVREILPVGFVMENVKGMLNWQGGRAIKALEYEFSEPVVHDGKEYHYEVSHDVLNSADYGVPQFRERVFIVGNRIGKKYTFPPPTHGDLSKAELLGSDLLPYATVLDAIGELPEADEPSEVAKRVSKTIKGRIERHGY